MKNGKLSHSKFENSALNKADFLIISPKPLTLYVPGSHMSGVLHFKPDIQSELSDKQARQNIADYFDLLNRWDKQRKEKGGNNAIK